MKTNHNIENFSVDLLLKYVFQEMESEEENSFELFLDSHPEYAEMVNELLNTCLENNISNRSEYLKIQELMGARLLEKTATKLQVPLKELLEYHPHNTSTIVSKIQNKNRIYSLLWRVSIAACIALLASWCFGLQQRINIIEEKMETVDANTRRLEIIEEQLNYPSSGRSATPIAKTEDINEIKSPTIPTPPIVDRVAMITDATRQRLKAYREKPPTVKSSRGKEIDFYSKGHYSEALPLLEEEARKIEQTSTLAYYQLLIGTCHLFNRDYKKAINILEKLHNSGDGLLLLLDAPQWYLATAYILDRQIELGQSHLTELIDEQSEDYMEDAQKIIDIINTKNQ